MCLGIARSVIPRYCMKYIQLIRIILQFIVAISSHFTHHQQDFFMKAQIIIFLWLSVFAAACWVLGVKIREL